MKHVAVSSHMDNTGARCRNVGPSTPIEAMRDHDCCYTCNDAADEFDEQKLLARLQTPGVAPRGPGG